MRSLAALALVALPFTAAAQATPQDTEVWTPVPKVVTPGRMDGDPPADAIRLFDGKHLNEWVKSGTNNPSAWTVKGGVMTVNKKDGNIATKRAFTNYQMHIEWRIPRVISGDGQGRGNSGLYLGHTGGDSGYEMQILDSYVNKTYVNGQAASIYKQTSPLVNAMRKPGEWNTYDVVWTAPTFNADGSVKTKARVTALHNGVLVLNNVELAGQTEYIGAPSYKPHGPLPLMLQSHGDPSEPISFRKIWLRELP